MTGCRLEYDLVTNGFSWWWPALGLAASALGTGALKLTSWWQPARWRRIYVWIPLVFGLLWGVGVFALMCSSYYELKHQYQSGYFSSVEGLIEDFQAGDPNHGGARDSFNVSGAHFSYAGCTITPGYWTMQAMGHGH